MRFILGLFLSLFAASASADRLTPIIGSTLMVGWPGWEISGASTQLLCQQLARGEVGGVLFLKHNVKSTEQVTSLTQYFARCGARFRPLLAVDQEGGKVDRLGVLDGVPRTPSAQSIGARSPALAQKTYAAMAARVKSLGFNVNFGPVADLNVNPRSPVIGRIERSFGARNIEPYLSAFIEPHDAARVSTAFKHFPGHGSSRTDSHKGFTDVTSTWSTAELVPFQNGMNQHPGTAIMAGHLVHRELDASGLPSSLSKAMLTNLLRNKMGFQGAIVSDDMEMRAITDIYGFDASIVLGLSAGLDLFIHANGGPYQSGRVAEYHAAVRRALAEGKITEADLRAKQARLNAWKR